MHVEPVYQSYWLQVKRKIVDQAVPFNESIKTEERKEKERKTNQRERESLSTQHPQSKRTDT
jgi:hypothetical protein